MAKQTIKNTTTKERKKKYGGNTGLVKCKNCGGDGVCKARKNKK